MITTKTGTPISFHFTTGKVANLKALNKISDNLPAESWSYDDKDYEPEYELFNK